MIGEPIFSELVNVHTKNELYNRWLDYLKGLTKDDIAVIVENGLTYHADAIRGMVREVIAGQQVHNSLLKKIDFIYRKTHLQARRLR